MRGGVAGTAVGLDELAAAAGQLAQCATVLGEVVVRLAAATAATGVSAPLSPVTAVRAEAELAGATRALAREAAAVGGVAIAVRSAAWAYREVEQEVVRTTALAQDVVMAAVGRATPTLVVGVVALDAIGSVREDGEQRRGDAVVRRIGPSCSRYPGSARSPPRVRPHRPPPA